MENDEHVILDELSQWRDEYIVSLERYTSDRPVGINHRATTGDYEWRGDPFSLYVERRYNAHPFSAYAVLGYQSRYFYLHIADTSWYPWWYKGYLQCLARLPQGIMTAGQTLDILRYLQAEHRAHPRTRPHFGIYCPLWLPDPRYGKPEWPHQAEVRAAIQRTLAEARDRARNTSA